MDNVFTPEEANKAVTYGELLTIFGPVIEELGKNSINYTDTLQENIFKIIKELTEHLVEVRDNTEYKRVRDMRFTIGLIAQLDHLDKEVMLKEYCRWCEEFDKINKPKRDDTISEIRNTNEGEKDE